MQEQCPKCQRAISAGTRFCTNCGTPVSSIKEQPEISQLLCPSCNYANKPGVKFCGSCGAPFHKTCLVCNTENPPQNKFCNNCGVNFDDIKPQEYQKRITPTHKTTDKKGIKRKIKIGVILGGITLALVLLVVIAERIYSSWKRERQYEQAIKEAREAWERGDLEKLKDAVELALKIKPNDKTAKDLKAKNLLLFEELKTFEGLGLAGISPDGRYLAIRDDYNVVTIREVQTGKEINRFRGTYVPFSPDNRYLAVYHDDVVIIHEVQTGKEINRFRGRGNHSVSFSPDGRYLVVCGKEDDRITYVVIIWEVQTGKEVNRFRESHFASFSPDGRYLAVCHVDVVIIREVQTGREVNRFRGGYFVFFSPDGRYLVVDQGGVSIIHEVQTGREVRRVKGNFGGFGPDGRYLAVEVDGDIIIQEVQTGREIRRFIGKQGHFFFSPNGKYLILDLERDKKIEVWGVKN